MMAVLATVRLFLSESTIYFIRTSRESQQVRKDRGPTIQTAQRHSISCETGLTANATKVISYHIFSSA